MPEQVLQSRGLRNLHAILVRILKAAVCYRQQSCGCCTGGAKYVWLGQQSSSFQQDLV